MSYSIIPTEEFRRHAKKLVKKYASLKHELGILTENLLENPYLGTSLGKNCFKIRLAVQSKGKGKRGGMRIITYLISDDKEIYLIDIYDKSEQSTISDKEVSEIIEKIDNKINK